MRLKLALPRWRRARPDAAPIPRAAPRRMAVLGWSIAALSAVYLGMTILMGGAGPKPITLALEPGPDHRESHGEPQVVEAGRETKPGEAGTPSTDPADAAEPKPADPAAERRASAADGEGKRVALVVRGLGLSSELTRSAIAQLPPDVALAFSPYGRDLEALIGEARTKGFEVYIELPVEPPGFPENDAGPKALLAALEPDDNRVRLDWSLGRVPRAAGVFLGAGGGFASKADAVSALAAALAERGYVLIHDGAEGTNVQDLAALRLEAVGPSEAGGPAAARLLKGLERRAGAKGAAAGVLPATPANLKAIAAWAEVLAAEDIVIVPPSALASKPAGG